MLNSTKTRTEPKSKGTLEGHFQSPWTASSGAKLALATPNKGHKYLLQGKNASHNSEQKPAEAQVDQWKTSGPQIP